MAVMLVALPAASASAIPAPTYPGGTQPPAAAGAFSGIYAWGAGASRCTQQETSTVLRFGCDGIGRNFIGSFVLIRFPSKSFNAHVQLARGSDDPRQGLDWYVQDTAPIPDIVARGDIHGSASVDLNGSQVPRCTIEGKPCPGGENSWDLGLDKVFGNYVGLPTTVNAVITITLIPS